MGSDIPDPGIKRMEYVIYIFHSFNPRLMRSVKETLILNMLNEINATNEPYVI